MGVMVAHALMTHDPVHEWTTVLAQRWEPRVKIHITLAAYKLSDVDTDTSHEKVVDMAHQAIVTRLQQLHLLK